MQAKTTDYEAWQHQDLVKRVLELEQKLRERTQSTQHGATANRYSTSRKLKKPPKAFDGSKYSTRKIALKFAYLGAEYNGLEHQRDNPLPAIEYVLWKAMKKTRLIFPKHKPGQSEDEVCWDGCEYSKCGRTDKGVSAFGQVITLRVRSARPVPRARKPEDGEDALGEVESMQEPFDPIKDELPYIQLLNRVLPPEIRILAWCADLPPDFNARYSCRERRYRYFFTNPAYLPTPGAANQTDGWLDIDAMRTAARKYEGLHDFRNLCKIDPGKQISDFRRRIFHADIHAVGDEQAFKDGSPKLYYFEVRGSAFLWHQVRNLVAILFLIGQGYEQPDLVDKLLDVELLPGKPVFDMASDVPLSLWDCIFPDLSTSDHASTDRNLEGYHDALPWIHVGEEIGGRDNGKKTLQEGDGKYGYRGIMEELWSIWRKRKLDEILAAQLMSLVAGQGHAPPLSFDAAAQPRSDRVFEGSELPRTVGTYTPVMQRHRMESPEVQNARYAARYGLNKEPQEGSGD
ncbi:hypothetical protein AMS68_002822 [Peltaster fructicola]|uniref:Pseudouridine synthase I TruA alpha/beta domain-containing protein n=1 Tax=Peltaster fructicola TaxID=286661 RepID=A0A6H0XRP7_9PEZI|nr:hypothetical protein AMS68_002822 [Peltaster fructicola]